LWKWNYIGCIGSDNNGKILTECCAKDNVKTLFMIDETTETGLCACAIKDKERSMVALLGAANNFKATHL
jgi:adenosine kinase